MIPFYLYRKVKIDFNSLIYCLMRSLRILLRELVSALLHAVVAVERLDILFGVVLISTAEFENRFPSKTHSFSFPATH